MKKIFYLIIALFIITGCEATYTIDIDDNFNESLVAVPKDVNEVSRMREDYFPYPAFYNPNYSEEDDYVEGYDRSYNDPNENDNTKDEEIDNYITTPVERYNVFFGTTLSFNYKFGSNYQDSNIVLTSVGDFDAVNAVGEGTYSKINAKDFTNIFEEYSNLTKLTVNIKTTKRVISNNADSVNGNIYTWVITSKNANRAIEFIYTDERYYANDTVVDPLPEPDNNTDPDNGNTIIPDDNNNGKKDNKKTSNNGLTKKQSKVVLYVLYALFFALIFGIIVVRTFDKNKK